MKSDRAVSISCSYCKPADFNNIVFAILSVKTIADF